MQKNIRNSQKDCFVNGTSVMQILFDGDGKTVEDVFGFPYTSSSEFAAIWNCQADAKYRWNREWRFEGLAVSEDNDAVAYFSKEMKDMFVIIGKVN